MNLTLESEVARLVALIDRRDAKRFLQVPELPSLWGALTEQKAATVTVNLGYAHPDDDGLIEWIPVQMTRKELADTLRDARYFRGERRTDTSIAMSVNGYSIYDWRR